MFQIFWRVLLVALVLLFRSAPFLVSAGRSGGFFRPFTVVRSSLCNTPSTSWTTYSASSISTRIRGGDELEESDDEDEGDDVLAELLDKSIDLSMRAGVLLLKGSKVAGEWIKHWSIIYFNACTRAVKAGWEEEEGDEEEDEDTSQVVVFGKRVFRTLKRMTVAFWTPKDFDAEEDDSSVFAFFGRFKLFKSDDELFEVDDDEEEEPETEEILAEIIEEVENDVESEPADVEVVETPVITAPKKTTTKPAKKRRNKTNTKKKTRKSKSKGTKGSVSSRRKKTKDDVPKLAACATGVAVVVVGVLALGGTNCELGPSLLAAVATLGSSVRKFCRSKLGKGGDEIYGLDELKQTDEVG